MNTNFLFPEFSHTLPQGYMWDCNLDRDSDEVITFIHGIWPKYLTQQPDIDILVPYDTADYQRYYNQRYFLWGIRRQQDQQLVACLSCASVYLEKPENLLDQQGWQWAKQNSILSEAVNCLCLLSATVSTSERANGLAKAMIESAKQLAISLGYDHAVVPARPSEKHRYPEMSFEDYLVSSGIKLATNNQVLNNQVKYKNTNRPVDPWIALHLSLGASVRNICWRSIEVIGSIDWWEQILAIKFNQQPQLNIEAGLVPLIVDWTKNIATYQEPNLWLIYQLTD